MRTGAVVLAGAALWGLAREGPAAEVKANVVKVSLSLDRTVFHRGGTDPASSADDLIAVVTLANPSDLVSMPVARPDVSPFPGSTEFEINRIGPPAGEPAGEAEGRTRMVRRPPLEAVGLRHEPQEAILGPTKSEEFRVPLGSAFDLTTPGKYEVRCVYRGELSEFVGFEVAPVRKVNVSAARLLDTLGDFERLPLQFPFMFYVTEAAAGHDEVIFLVREGSGGSETYEHYMIGTVGRGVVPATAVSGTRVGIVVPDRRMGTVSRFFTVDAGLRPVRIEAKRLEHEAGAVPEPAALLEEHWAGRQPPPLVGAPEPKPSE
jgi:hypothetical protein